MGEGSEEEFVPFMTKKGRTSFQISGSFTITNVSKEKRQTSLWGCLASLFPPVLFGSGQPDYQQSQDLSRAFLSVYQYWAMSIL